MGHIRVSATTDWTGAEWQAWCETLWRKRYASKSPHDLQMVPAKHQGDLGMEAFSHDGHLYQCYAVEEPISTAERYGKQRDKLSTDLFKLKTKKLDVKKVLGSVIVKKYIYMVPLHDSRHLVSHAQTKAAEVKGWKLPFISQSFAIVIETEDDYVTERDLVLAIPKPLIDPVPLNSSAIPNWKDSNSELKERALSKLAGVLDENARSRVFDALLRKYLDGENALDRLRVASPEGYQSIQVSVSHKESVLVLDYSADPEGTQRTLKEIAGDLSEEFLSVCPILDKRTTETLAWASVADWLMRCPLSFGDN